MSKFVKNLITDHVRSRLQNVHDALLVNVVGMNAMTNHRLRGELAGKNIHLLVVNNSLAHRAMADTPLASLFEGVAGCAAVCWGSEDIVSLAKEITKLIGSEKYKPLEARGGVMDGERLPAAGGRGEQVAQPQRAVELVARPNPQPRRQPGEPVDRGRRGAGQPDRAERDRTEEDGREGAAPELRPRPPLTKARIFIDCFT